MRQLSPVHFSPAVPVEEKVVEEVGFVVDLLVELEVGIDHVLDVVADLGVEGGAGVLGCVDGEAGCQAGIGGELFLQ